MIKIVHKEKGGGRKRRKTQRINNVKEITEEEEVEG